MVGFIYFFFIVLYGLIVFFVYGLLGLLGQSFESLESVDFDLFNHYLFAIVDIDAALRRLAVEAATVEGVPRIARIRGIREIRSYNSRCLVVAEVQVEGADENHGDGSPDHFFTQRSFILSWHTIIIVGAVANLYVWLCRLQARTYSEYSKLFKGE